MLELPNGDRLAFSTDSYVVQPLRFPGGSIGHLAVHGTINDLAMMGARPIGLSAAFVLEEGFSIAALREHRRRHGRGGVGSRRRDRHRRHQGRRPGQRRRAVHLDVRRRGDPGGATAALRRRRSRPGDVVLVSGTIGDHGMAVMLARGDLALDADIASDTAPLDGVVEVLLGAAPRTSDGCATPRAAASAPCATSWLATPT